MDRLTKEQRRKTMQAVKSSGSAIETRLCKALWRQGYRYRKNYAKLVGKPDIVFVSKRIAIFCDSEFWHGHDWENRKHDFKSNHEFWFKKIERNMARDKEVTDQLTQAGWTVLRFWGRELTKNLDFCIRIIEDAMQSNKEGTSE